MAPNLGKFFSHAEKMLIANSEDTHIVYNCSQHGVFQRDKDIEKVVCPFINCTGSVYKLENIEKLKDKFKLYRLT